MVLRSALECCNLVLGKVCVWWREITSDLAGLTGCLKGVLDSVMLESCQFSTDSSQQFSLDRLRYHQRCFPCIQTSDSQTLQPFMLQIRASTKPARYVDSRKVPIPLHPVTENSMSVSSVWKIYYLLMTNPLSFDSHGAPPGVTV